MLQFVPDLVVNKSVQVKVVAVDEHVIGIQSGVDVCLNRSIVSKSLVLVNELVTNAPPIAIANNNKDFFIIDFAFLKKAVKFNF